MYNGSSTSPGYSVVVCLPEPPDCADACLCQEVHGKVTEALLRDDHIWLVPDDLSTNILYILLLHLQQCCPETGTLTCALCLKSQQRTFGSARLALDLEQAACEM